MVEPRRSSAVNRYSGTMNHPAARGKMQLTISAFEHFTFEHSDHNVVLADVQGMFHFFHRLDSSDSTKSE